MCRCDYGECKGAACDCRCHRRVVTEPDDVIRELRASLAAAQKQIATMRELLEWMDRIGGLGHEVHQRIAEVLGQRRPF